MKLLKSLDYHSFNSSPYVVTIGFFDGVHIGHQKLFQFLEKVKKPEQKSLVITFENHPTSITQTQAATPLIYPLHQRLNLLKKQSIDSLCVLQFTEKFRLMTADEFISLLEEVLVLDTLVLGPSSRFGYQKKGDQECIRLLSKKYGFDFKTIDFVTHNNDSISSSLIRQQIEKADFQKVSDFLGRSYSLHLPVIPGAQIGRSIGFPTLNLSVEGLVLPPIGVYEGKLIVGDQSYKAICNLGFAPTLQERTEPNLEVHVLNTSFDHSPDHVEVELLRFIRPEKKFSSKDQLVKQIKTDIKSVQT